MVSKPKVQNPVVLQGQNDLLRAIVESSDDAILTKNLDGLITSWNKGAERLFGYTAAQIMGAPVGVLLPPDRLDEEMQILARIRNGERVENFETIRLHRSGRPIHISLTCSPLHDAGGRIVGASKIARDNTQRHQAQEMQSLLIGEMQHRIKNVFTLAGSLVSLSASQVETKEELVKDVRSRLRALASAHELTVPVLNGAYISLRRSAFRETIDALFQPYLGEGDSERVTVQGPELTFAPKAVTPVALLVNELVTNAVKYGALRDPDGRITITTARDDLNVRITWHEQHDHMGSPPTGEEKGFGSTLSRLAVEQQLGGTLLRVWGKDGLHVTVTFPLANLDDDV